MKTILMPRARLLHETLIDGLDSAVTVADELLDDGKSARLAVCLGAVESAASWLLELATHYKSVLDEVAIALSQARGEVDNPMALEAAFLALEKVQAGYIDSLCSDDESARPGV